MFNLASSTTNKVRVDGISTIPSDMLECSAPVGGKRLAIGFATRITVADALTITCQRRFVTNRDSSIHYMPATVTLQTNNGPYVIDFQANRFGPTPSYKQLSSEIGLVNQRLDGLTRRDEEIDDRLSAEQQSVRYILIDNGQNCPAGWTEQGSTGILMKTSEVKFGRGGYSGIPGWHWTHPVLCKRN